MFLFKSERQKKGISICILYAIKISFMRNSSINRTDIENILTLGNALNDI